MYRCNLIDYKVNKGDGEIKKGVGNDVENEGGSKGIIKAVLRMVRQSFLFVKIVIVIIIIINYCYFLL